MRKKVPFRIVSDDEVVQARLLNKARLTESGCWQWIGKTQRRRYGLFWHREKYTGAHRVSYEVFVGPIPAGLVVRHSCDNPGCINPNHLSLGTQKDNARDRTERGRGHKLKGELIGTSKLTESQVREIRASVNMSLQDIAQKYGIDKSNAWAIRAGKSWKHVSTDAPSTDKELGDAR